MTAAEHMRDDQRRVAVAGMMDHRIQTAQGVRRVAGKLARVHQYSAIGTISQLILLPLVPRIVVLARSPCALTQAGEPQLAAVEPVGLHATVRFFADPVGAECHQDLGLLARLYSATGLLSFCSLDGGRLKNAHNVLLPVGGGEAVAVGIDDGVDAQADAGRLGDVLEQIHLLAVVVDAVEVVALAPDRVEQAMLLDLASACRRSARSRRPGSS